MTEHYKCDHNCIPVRKWFRSGWVCVRCHRFFRQRPMPRRYLGRVVGSYERPPIRIQED